MRFYGGRISLLPIKQNIFYKEGNEGKFALVLSLLSEPIEYKATKGNVIIMEPILDENNLLIGGKIGRKSMMKLPLQKDGKLNKYPTVVYPHVIFIIKDKEQVILIELNTQVFSNSLKVFEYIRKYLNQKLAASGIEVFIKPLTSKGAFWEITNQMSMIYHIGFNLTVPNLIGDSYGELKKMLEIQKDNFNANTVNYGVSNDSGKLEVKENNNLKVLISWVEDGCGDWLIKGKAIGVTRRGTYRNTDQLTIFYSETEMDMEEDMVKYIKRLKESIDISSHTSKGDQND